MLYSSTPPAALLRKHEESPAAVEALRGAGRRRCSENRGRGSRRVRNRTDQGRAAEENSPSAPVAELLVEIPSREISAGIRSGNRIVRRKNCRNYRRAGSRAEWLSRSR